MPFKDRDRKREYQRIWIAKRRQEWFDEHGPCVDCGSWIDLEADHIDPLHKCSHRIWSYSKKKREYELSKCVARCKYCHTKKTRAEGSYGRQTPYQRFVPNNVSEAYELTQENQCFQQSATTSEKSSASP